MRALLGGLLAVALLLSVTSSAFAGEQAGGMDTAGLLAYGAGYGSEGGSPAVRELQLRLRRAGDDPGPIDGLFGPLTEGAVRSFQLEHGVTVDGMAGPQTKSRLLVPRVKRPSPRSERPSAGSKRPSSPAGERPNPTPERPPRSAGVAPPDRSAPASSSPLAPVFAGLVAGLAAALLLAAASVLRSRNRTRPETARVPRTRRPVAAKRLDSGLNLGIVCAALLAMFAIGAIGGAVFATQAAPEDRPEVSAERGAVLPPLALPAEKAAAKQRREGDDSPRHRRIPSQAHAGATVRKAPAAAPPEQLADTSQTGARADLAPPADPTPVTPPGERSKPTPDNSQKEVARQAESVARFKFEDPVSSADPDPIVSGARSRRP